MFHFKYVSKKELAPFKQEIINLIHLVQDDVRESFTFQFRFIGSVERNMVTYDPTSNIGFDFDVNLYVNDDSEDYEPGEIKHILMDAFNKHTRKYRYDNCENSTRVFTIKVKDKENSKILHSCDFAIVNDYGDDQQEYIRFNKPKGYAWVEQSEKFYLLRDKIDFCKDNSLWTEVRNLYLEKKNTNKVKGKKSRSIFAETVHQICQQNGYYED